MPTWRRKYYDYFSKYYDRFVALHSSDPAGGLRAYLADQTGLSEGGRVLDICTGTGSLLLKLREKTASDGLVVGIDFSKKPFYDGLLELKSLLENRALRLYFLFEEITKYLLRVCE